MADEGVKCYEHILFATDLSLACEAPAEKAKTISEVAGSDLSLVHVIEPIPSYGYPGFADLQSPIIDSAKAEMAKLGEHLGVPAERLHTVFGSVKTEVLKVAETLGVDLIVIGSHGRHGISRLLGSGANAIVHGAKCDVLTIRCTDFE